MNESNENKMELRISVIKQLFILHRKIVDVFLTISKSDELSRTEIMILFLLRKKEYKTTNIAKEMGIPSSTVTGLIDRLIDKGYVQRYRSKEDRRVVMVGLGPQVQGKIDQLNEKIEKLAEMVETDLPKEWWIQIGEELSKFEKVLDEVDETLK
ncbi:MarR family transcriptional regulator [Lutibacter sp. B2]|nr:MarR family transcriptional regulator [Lutibacter sp. B2]